MGLIDPDISAPGVCITSLDYSSDDKYVGGPMWSGTSMATPHVAGAMALMLSKNSGLAQAIMDSILEMTSVDYGFSGKDTDYGAGRLDCYEAFIATPVGVGESKETVYPGVFSLSKIAPNPFYNGTFISYQIPDGRSVQTVIEVYDITGKSVKTLINSQHDPGWHSVYWDGRDGLDRRVASGIYFMRFMAGNYTRTGKMLLLR